MAARLVADVKAVAARRRATVLGPLLFNFYIHDILENFNEDFSNEIKIKLFADDLKAYIEFNPYKKTENYSYKLQIFIDYFYQWCNLNGLTISNFKCSILHMGINNPKANYYIEKFEIEKVTIARDLGIYITPNLNWFKHILHKSKIANARFFAIFKAFKSDDPKFLCKLYTCYVRPILEFGSSVFNSNIVKNIEKLESVQKRITRLIFSRCLFRRYPCPPEYSRRLEILDLEPLKTRYLKKDLTLVHKFRLGEYSMLNKTLDFSLMKKKRNRYYNFIAGARSKVRNNSFYIRAVKKYFKLPPEIIEAKNVHLFKQKLDDINVVPICSVLC